MSEQSLVPMNGSGSEVAALFDPYLSSALSNEERALLGAMLSKDEKIDVAIPEEVTVEDLWKALDVCSKVLADVRRAGTQLKLLVGRALVIMQKHPEIWESRGFRSFDAFMTDKDGLPKITGISRPELYKAKGIAEKWPTISMGEYRTIGFSRLAVISSVVSEGDSNSRFWIEAAKENTVLDLKEMVYRSDNQIPRGSLDRDVLMIPMARDLKEQILEFTKKPTSKAKCESDDPGVILAWACVEAGTQWESEAIERD